ncbi:MAG TPA: winged helix-turn-helix domain-containing protein [Allosphingosinicella sp.]|nr:winged helix-turn-helix domain-containing protein [Allosphingosinicella sp.]
MHGTQGKALFRREPRRWKFASAVLDEPRWTLFVDGRAVAIQTKPLELLRELLLRAGEVVTKDELLDAVWPDVLVVEASLSTAILKLRRVLGEGGDGAAIIETVPRIGYRLAVPVEVEWTSNAAERAVAPPAGADAESDTRPAPPRSRFLPRAMVAGGLALALVAAILAAQRMRGPETFPARPLANADAARAIRSLDLDRIEQMLRAGWDPNQPFDTEDNAALHTVLNICEWNPVHDRERLLQMSRTLIEGGARFDARNIWGDTPYSIAKAPRYCGPDHPVTTMLHRLCYAGYLSPGDRCQADYAGARRRR